MMHADDDNDNEENQAQEITLLHNRRSFFVRKESNRKMSLSASRLPSIHHLTVSSASASHEPSDNFRRDFLLLQVHPSWQKIEHDMVRMLKLADDHLNDITYFASRIFLTKQKLIRYMFEKSKYEFIKFDLQVLKYIQTECWPLLKNALLRLKKEMELEKYNKIGEQLIECILNTFHLTSCAEEVYKNLLANSSMLSTDKLPQDIVDSWNQEEHDLYEIKFNELMVLIKQIRGHLKEAKENFSQSQDDLMRSQSGAGFIALAIAIEKFKQYIKAELHFSDINKFHSLMKEYKIIEIFIKVLTDEDLAQIHKDLLWEVKGESVKEEEIYLNLTYLNDLFRVMAKLMFKAKGNDSKLNESFIKKFKFSSGMLVLREWITTIIERDEHISFLPAVVSSAPVMHP